MDTETRAAIAAMGDMMSAGFARMDRYFELRQAQYLELRAEMRTGFADLRDEIRGLRDRLDALTERVDALSGRVDSLAARLTGLEHEVAHLRDYMTREIAEIRLELRGLRVRSDQTDELRREIDELTARVDQLERRQQD